MNILGIVPLLITSLLAIDCVYDPTNIDSNCLIYCILKYSATPQRRYYNQTSQNCEYMYACPPILSTHYYDYDTNKCYDSPAMKNIVESPIDNNTGIVINLGTMDFICLYGTITLRLSQRRYFCVCHLLWVSSGNMTSSGIPFKCDKVETNMSKVFQKITYNNGVVSKYDNFTVAQVNALLTAALKVQARFKQKQSKQSQVPVHFLLQSLRKQPLIPQSHIPIIVIACLLIIALMGFTIFNYWSNKIKISKSQLKQRIKQLANIE